MMKATKHDRKFSEEEREAVIKELEQILGKDLYHIEPYDRLLKSYDPVEFHCVLGGEMWHGLQAKLLDFLERTRSPCWLVIAQRDDRNPGRFEIYRGSMDAVLAYKCLLHTNQSGDRQFNLLVQGRFLLIKEIPGYRMERIGECIAN